MVACFEVVAQNRTIAAEMAAAVLPADRAEPAHTEYRWACLWQRPEVAAAAEEQQTRVAAAGASSSERPRAAVEPGGGGGGDFGEACCADDGAAAARVAALEAQAALHPEQLRLLEEATRPRSPSRQ